MAHSFISVKLGHFEFTELFSAIHTHLIAAVAQGHLPWKIKISSCDS